MPFGSGGGGGGGGLPTTGGTLTGELIVAPSLQVDPAFLVTPNPADTANTYMRVTGDGILALYSGGARQEATLELHDNTPGNNGDISLDTFSGLLLAIEASGQTALSIPPKATHTGDLLNVRGVDSNESCVIDAVGHLRILRHAAPADAGLVAGECAFWFDQTNGAAKLMLKGKTADGTVVAASVAMA